MDLIFRKCFRNKFKHKNKQGFYSKKKESHIIGKTPNNTI